MGVAVNSPFMPINVDQVSTIRKSGKSEQ